MKNKLYFLSFLILFLFNVNSVSAAITWVNVGATEPADNFCFGDCPNAYQNNITYYDKLTTWVGIPGSNNTPFYFHFYIAPNEIGGTEEKYENAVVEYKFCTSWNDGFTPTNIYTPPWNYQIIRKTNEGCTSTFGSGYNIYIYAKTDFTGNFAASDKIKITPNSSGAWWLEYKSYKIYTLSQYNDEVFYSQVNDNLNNIQNNQNQTNEKLDNLNDSITDSDSTEATGEASDFFSNFNTDTFGLTSVITAPLELIKSVTSKTCTPLQGTLPFVNTDVNLPCLSTIYENHFGTFLNIYRTITFGFVSYWVCIKIFNLVKDFKNPEHDEIEVLDL